MSTFTTSSQDCNFRLQHPGLILAFTPCSRKLLTARHPLLITGFAQVRDTSHAGAARDLVHSAEQLYGAKSYIRKCVGALQVVAALLAYVSAKLT